MSYSEKLKDPRWQKFRLKIFERDYWQCMRCDCDNKQLHAHHLRYENGKDPWEYNSEEIVTLCEDCHAKAHDDDENVRYQVYKEIIPISNRWRDEILEFNKFYLNFYEDKRNITESHDHYCRCIRAYFIDAEFNFTTSNNIIKKLKGLFLPIASCADETDLSMDEVNKILLLSQKYDYKFLYNDIDKLMKSTINRIYTEPLILSSTDSADNNLNAFFYIFVLKQMIGNVLGLDNTFEIIENCLLFQIKEITKDPLYFMWDENKWIECFDSIDYTPPELQKDKNQ